MTKYMIRNLKVFKTGISSSYQNILQNMGRRKYYKCFFIFKQLEKCQKEYCLDNPNLIGFCRGTSFHVLMFTISLLKMNLWSYWKWKIWPFSWLLKIDIYFPKSTLIPHICYYGIFFWEYIEVELKMYFIILQGTFEWQN